MIGDEKWRKHVESLSDEEKELWQEILEWKEYGILFYDDEKKEAYHHNKNNITPYKIIECDECAYFFKVPNKDTKTCLCPSCKWEHKKELTRLRVRKYREKEKE